MKIKKSLFILGIVLLSLGIISVVNSLQTITGFAIYEGLPIKAGWYVGITLLFLGLLSLIGATLVEEEVEEGELEKMTNKLFVEGKKRGANTVRLHDPLGNFRSEIGTKADSDTAYDVLASLSEKYADDKEAREMLQELLGEAGYFDVAYHQRDSAPKLKRNTAAHAADEFLSKWDPNYREWVEPASPLLTYQPHEGIRKLNNDTGDYDTRNALPILKDNIEGFEIEDSPIPAGDVSVSYKGAGFQVFAGHDYSVDKSSIIRALNRISKEDVKKGDIESEDRSLRLSVLKDYIFD
ncbi:hypothetical protein CMI45_03345 [Candidatus Pacearchaeota archaeon]|nr:hypothetical protein [Candidatus Pacearchaeota archaeon]|tara:strand:- start:1153 stop:2037 length:885 start_codon:yes stop_codon:yes gene_type:complete